MTTLTWLGEDSLYLAGDAPQHTTWNGIAFEKGKPVKVDDPAIIEKAKNNQFFKIEGQIGDMFKAEEPEVLDETDAETEHEWFTNEHGRRAKRKKVRHG